MCKNTNACFSPTKILITSHTLICLLYISNSWLLHSYYCVRISHYLQSRQAYFQYWLHRELKRHCRNVLANMV